MTIVKAMTATGRPVPEHQIKADKAELLRRHEELMQRSYIYPFFGGIVVVGDRAYQLGDRDDA